MGLRDVLEKFANGTTMHGVPKVINARSTFARCFWSLVCVAAGAMFCMQMSEVLQRYFSYPKKVTVEVVPAPVPFPSISLCNMRNLDVYVLNLLNRKFLEDPNPINHINDTDVFIREYMKLSAKYGPLWYQYQDFYPLVFQEVFSRTTYSANIPEEVISEAAVQVDQFVVNCYLGEYSCNRSTDFKRFFDPYYFSCFTYTSPDEEDKSLSEGIENGWSSILFSGSGILDKNEDIRVLPGLHESRSPVSANEGVRVVIHPPGTIPFPFTEGFDVPPGFSASFGIRPRRIKRIGQPHGNCTDQNPFGENLSSRYRVMTCQKMCLQRHVILECGCKDKSLPDVPGLNASPCRNADDFPDSCMLNATEVCLNMFFKLNQSIQCIRNTKDAVTKNSSIMEYCRCFPPCDELFYDVSYSLSKWPASGYEGDAAYFDVFFIESFKDRFINTPKFNMVDTHFSIDNRETAMKDFARLNVYIADSNVILTQEEEDYSSTQLVSDIGGQLGLWIGISIITLAEVLELTCDLCRFLWSLKRAAQRHSPPQRMERMTKFNHCNNLYVSAFDGVESHTMLSRRHNGDSVTR